MCICCLTLLALTVFPPCADESSCWRSSCYEDSSVEVFVLCRDRCHQHRKMHTASTRVMITKHIQMGAETASKTPRVIHVTQRTMTDDSDDEELVIRPCSSPLSWLLQPFCFKRWGPAVKICLKRAWVHKAVRMFVYFSLLRMRSSVVKSDKLRNVRLARLIWHGRLYLKPWHSTGVKCIDSVQISVAYLPTTYVENFFFPAALSIQLMNYAQNHLIVLWVSCEVFISYVLNSYLKFM